MTDDEKAQLDAIFKLPRFTRALSSEPKEGYKPSIFFENMYEETDETLRNRISKVLNHEP